MGIAGRIPGLKQYILSFFQDSAPTNGTTTKVPTVNATYDAIEAAKTAVVAQTITNGITASAPSQDAVYDALVGKAGLDQGSVLLTGLAAKPTTPPAAGSYQLYFKTDGKLYVQNNAGTETLIGGQTA